MSYDHYGAKHPHTLCERCDRQIRLEKERVNRLAEADFCGPCGRPISPAGEKQADQAGWLALAKQGTGRRPARSFHQTRSLPEVLL